MHGVSRKLLIPVYNRFACTNSCGQRVGLKKAKLINLLVVIIKFNNFKITKELIRL